MSYSITSFRIFYILKKYNIICIFADIIKCVHLHYKFVFLSYLFIYFIENVSPILINI